ncbi:hypothetical protein F444_12982 [Phytophthora nicotianae P1976]|uniref:DDE-1 domain-containing protein n=1 Tax=Phytophthora nicotianae P1976 TaxID=1317066 RepID=A0A080ZV99_PHYNI|nr:hypothetical protein F444_12982 [Phytophthora nicotianae P1976]
MPAQRKSLEISLKQQAIDWIESEGGGIPSRAEPHFRQLGWRVSASAYHKWWRDWDQIRTESVARFRLFGGGRKPLLGVVENELVDLLQVARKSSTKATQSDSSRPIRGCLTLRKRTNLTTLGDDELVERAVSYMTYLGEHKPSMNRDRTILMDETAVYFEDARTHTVDEVGARHVVIRSTGFSSMRITAALAVTASGKKLPPSLIWKRKTRGPIERVGGCYVAYQERAWTSTFSSTGWIGTSLK